MVAWPLRVNPNINKKMLHKKLSESNHSLKHTRSTDLAQPSTHNERWQSECALMLIECRLWVSASIHSSHIKSSLFVGRRQHATHRRNTSTISHSLGAVIFYANDLLHPIYNRITMRTRKKQFTRCSLFPQADWIYSTIWSASTDRSLRTRAEWFDKIFYMAIRALIILLLYTTSYRRQGKRSHLPVYLRVRLFSYLFVSPPAASWLGRWVSSDRQWRQQQRLYSQVGRLFRWLWMKFPNKRNQNVWREIISKTPCYRA